MKGELLENALSIDLEDWFHPLLVQPFLRDVERVSRVVDASGPLLELLDRHDVRATFFCVGEILEHHPELIREINGRGHEIGFHGMTHRPLWDLTPTEFETEVRDFEGLTARVLGQERSVRGFRAPTFSLDAKTTWALPILARFGYSYDSSVFPMRGPLYGVPAAPVSPYRVSAEDPGAIDANSPLLEFPPAVCEVMGMRIPVGGGFYLRLLPLPMLAKLLELINRDRPFVLYVHPWETDPATPRMNLKPLARFATYHGLGSTLAKLDRLLTRFRFTTVDKVIQNWIGQSPVPTPEAEC